MMGIGSFRLLRKGEATQGVMVKNVGNGVTHLSHGFLQRAGGLGGIGTVRTFLVGRLADTADRGQRPV